jgi:5-methylcytosine-specific restriction endonuclease McrA
MVEALRAMATIEPVLVDDAFVPLATGRARTTMSAKMTRAVLLRDGRCRWPGCVRRTGLHVHHLWPRSWGGTDETANLAAVCVGSGTDHHDLLAPHGPYLLLGNPNQPDGLRLVRRDDLARQTTSTADSRAGPSAA